MDLENTIDFNYVKLQFPPKLLKAVKGAAFVVARGFCKGEHSRKCSPLHAFSPKPFWRSKRLVKIVI